MIWWSPGLDWTVSWNMLLIELMGYATTELNNFLADVNERLWPQGSRGTRLFALFRFYAVIELPAHICYTS